VGAACHMPDDQSAHVSQALDAPEEPREPMGGDTKAMTTLRRISVPAGKIPSSAAFPPENPVVRMVFARIVRIHDEIVRVRDMQVCNCR
jgi:hypothetical protein